MKFFLLFDSTPLTPGIPLKALTSQGMRLDVACRMLRACVLGSDGYSSGHSVSAWFAGVGKDRPAVALHIDKQAIDDRITSDRFRSELVLASYLKELVAGISNGIRSGIGVGIHLELLDEATSTSDAFLESIRREKYDVGKKVILLHEQGIPIFEKPQPGMLVWREMKDDDAAIIVGNHRGFPARVEEALLSLSDNVLSVGTDLQCNGTGGRSYLGSHVITFVQMFHGSV